jgi:ankyrin repeat protein
VDVNAQRQDHQTPLHLACYSGRHEIAQLLLDRGANARAGDSSLSTPLHHVAGGQYPSQEDGIRVARLLLEHGADISAQNSNRETPLHTASSYGRLEIARMLLERTIVTNDQGQNPSHLGLEGEYYARNTLALPILFLRAHGVCECPQEGPLDSVASCLTTVGISRLYSCFLPMAQMHTRRTTSSGLPCTR